MIEKLVQLHSQLTTRSRIYDEAKRKISADLSSGLTSSSSLRVKVGKDGVTIDRKKGGMVESIIYPSNYQSQTKALNDLQLIFAKHLDSLENGDKIRFHKDDSMEMAMKLCINQERAFMHNFLMSLGYEIENKLEEESTKTLISNLFFSSIAKKVYPDNFKNFALKKDITVEGKKYHGAKLYKDKEDLISAFHEVYMNEIFNNGDFSSLDLDYTSPDAGITYNGGLFLLILMIGYYFFKGLDARVAEFEKEYNLSIYNHILKEHNAKTRRKSTESIKLQKLLENKEGQNISNLDNSLLDNKSDIYIELFNKIDDLLGSHIDLEYINRIKRIIKNKGFIKTENISRVIENEDVARQFVGLLQDNDIQIVSATKSTVNETKEQIASKLYDNINNDILSELKIKSTDDLANHLNKLGYIDPTNLEFFKNSIKDQFTDKHIFKILKTIDGTINFEGKGMSIYSCQILVIEIGKGGRLLFHDKEVVYFANHDDYDIWLQNNKKRK